ncbi:MAG: carboxynorspermidine decarboxylase [Candidatus Thiodiazotropha sp. (ex Myrtea sp. 'scaly one' KF741663)]|nr:carboxynorspermidine decarboxylase [Candidatus Thiodiazotropha sp. (ex Myrtea sp. 'scaly one' KF741663)]
MKAKPKQLPSPCFLIEENLLRKNLELIQQVEQRAGVTVILALKGFANWSVFPIVSEYLSGCSASSLNEARLAKEEFGGHVHTYAPAYTDAEFGALLTLSDRISFNSLSQWQKFSTRSAKAGVSSGLRVNPGVNEVETALYNPAFPQSRLGIPREELDTLPEGIEGLHVHALCENDAESSERLIAAVEDKFGHLLDGLQWVNFGGGHLMTRKGYDIDLLVNALSGFHQRHPYLDVVLEPGGAVAWQTGALVSTVLDLVKRGGMDIAILDTSATAHMPDVLEMPYRPDMRNAGLPGSKPHTYMLGGLTCLAGDVIGKYAFDKPLKVGDQLIFEDMIHYTMVKTTMFNGVQHPALAVQYADGHVEVKRQFGYEDYRSRLG